VAVNTNDLIGSCCHQCSGNPSKLFKTPENRQVVIWLNLLIHLILNKFIYVRDYC
jgi:hypothetical protein